MYWSHPVLIRIETFYLPEEGLASRAAAIRSRFTITANWRGGIERRTGRWSPRSGLNGVAMTMPPLTPWNLTSADSGASPKFTTTHARLASLALNDLKTE